jgi:peptide chain release factor 1
MEQKEQAIRAELAELDTKLQDPAVFADKNYPKLAKRQSALQDLLKLFDEKAKLAEARASAEALKINPDAEMQQMALAELEELAAKIKHNDEQLIEALTPQDPNK